MEPTLETLISLYISLFGQQPDSILPLSGAGSNRKYYRLGHVGKESTVIGVIGEDRKENHAFLTLAHQMIDAGIAVPAILAHSNDEMVYIQQDLGTVSLYDLIAKCHKQGEWSDEVRTLLHQIMAELPKIQFETAKGFNFEQDTAKQKHLDRTNIFWDFNYFKYCFLKPCNLPFDEASLEEDFVRLSDDLLVNNVGRSTFLYRDFQSRNIMIKDGRPYYIDFQGGFDGPYYYDVASFLWQARAAYPIELREELLHTYHRSLQRYQTEEYEDFVSRLMTFVHFRLIQVLGAYGFRGLFERKAMFLSPIRQALSLVKTIPECVISRYPVIAGLLDQVDQLPQFQSTDDHRLHVRVTSFSFKKGIPEDYSGNGGGFVFDCRAPHNPGRYKEYKNKTGLDPEVIDFLEGKVHDYDDEKLGTELTMPQYLENVYGIVDPAVETYLKRGFTSLMVSFGCTGGQHRSVYGAQQLAEHLHAKYPDAVIELWHREQGIYQIL